MHIQLEAASINVCYDVQFAPRYSSSMTTIFNRCAAINWCKAKYQQVCGGSLEESQKETRKIEK
jgi:hypothetical protein